MDRTGSFYKMESILEDADHAPALVQYSLPVGDARIDLNACLGGAVGLHYLGEIHCIHCGRLTKKSFAQGYCYPCFISLPQTGACILRPEMCEAHLGISRDMEWSRDHCLQDHIVYLALSGGLKVGVTRISQVPTRWIDQGAWKAIKLARTPNRYTSGTIEVALKRHMSDKTNWRKMLTNKLDTITDLQEAKEKAGRLLTEEHHRYLTEDDAVTEIQYPVQNYPEKVKSINLDANPDFEGVLEGIKGQYLLFEGGYVINIRKYGGYRMLVVVD